MTSKSAIDRALAAKSRRLRRRINFYPPYLGASVRVTHISEDFRRVEVEMPLRFYNRNYVGTHFGGSLYSMCDPFYMLMLINILGPDYIVWDKAATIRFRKPGKGLMKATFELTEEKIAEIRAAAETQPKAEPLFLVLVKDEEGNVVAEIDKLLYIKKKPQKA
jgi:acyl-coenzyme A thioesterase PaaI-like protein